MGSLAMTTFGFLVLVPCLSEAKAVESFYMVIDKPMITYSDRSILPFINLTSVRYGRCSKLYYSDLHIDISTAIDNNFTIEVVFYEAVSTQFKRSFIEMHFKICNFVFKDPIFGATLRKQLKFETCPIPKGSYHFYNMTASADHLPTMPFRKGRIHMEMFYKRKSVFKVHADLELKRKKKV